MDSPLYNFDDLDPSVDYNPEVLQFFANKLEPTEEDIKRQLTNDEIKELCIRVKCRVEAYRWNPVSDYKRYFEDRNRFAGKSPKAQVALLAKAVNRHINTMKYDEDFIKKTRRKEWVIQKKDNIMSLDLWAYEREQMISSSTESSLVVAENESESMVEEQLQQISEDPGPSEHAISLMVLSEQSLSLTERATGMDEFQSVDEIPDAYNSENLRERGVDTGMCKLFDVHTESMTVLDSEESAVPISSQGPSQDVFHNNYEDFDTGVPMTSTQSQQVESQEDQVN